MQRLTSYEREQLAYWRRSRLSIRVIARLMHRDHSVLVRELRRNTGGVLPYSSATAIRATIRRSQKTNVYKLAKYPVLHTYVERQLHEGWCPELIAGRLRTNPPLELRDPRYRISHESIYRYI